MKLVFENVCKGFGEKQVFSDFSHTFVLEGITALMGASGCGKTTLLRLMSGMDKPQSGKILGIPQRVTVLFQEDRLLPWISVLENVALVCDQAAAEKRLCEVGLASELHAMPQELSGGMRRRVALARALAHKSELLLLDEPFQGLDEALCKQMLALLQTESAVRPILFVTHDRAQAQAIDAPVLYLHGNPAKL